MRSFTRSRCGLVYAPTCTPSVVSNATAMRVVVVFPFVPVRWMIGYSTCGEPSRSTIAWMRASVGAFALAR